MDHPFAGATKITHHWRRSLLGFGSVAVMALVLALAAVLGLIDAEVAVEGCIALAVLAGVFHSLMRFGFSTRFSDAGFLSAQLAAVFVLLAWLTYRVEDTPSAISVLYLVAMLYGMLQLDRTRLAVLASVAAITHGTALFMLIDDGHRIQLAAAWTQFGALVLAFAWFTYTAGIILRLRARLSEAQRRLHDLGLEANQRASRDTLTGVYHHRHLMDALVREMAPGAGAQTFYSLKPVHADEVLSGAQRVALLEAERLAAEVKAEAEDEEDPAAGRSPMTTAVRRAARARVATHYYFAL